MPNSNSVAQITPQVLILKAVDESLNFRGRKAAASMASKAKTDARFELSVPKLPRLVPVFEAPTGPSGTVGKASVLLKKVEKPAGQMCGSNKCTSRS